MKPLLFMAIAILSTIAAQAQPYLTVNNYTSCNAFADMYCRDLACDPSTGVSTSGSTTFAPGTTVVDATTLPGWNSSVTYYWQYGRVGNICNWVPGGGGCSGTVITLSNGNCVGGSFAGGCVLIDNACSGGCAQFNIRVTWNNVTGDAQVDIYP